MNKGSLNSKFVLQLTFKNHQAVFFRLYVFITSAWPAWGPFLLCVAIAARLGKIKAINQFRLSRTLIFDRVFVIIWKINRTTIRKRSNCSSLRVKPLIRLLSLQNKFINRKPLSVVWISPVQWSIHNFLIRHFTTKENVAL